jgi:hypothetical protein
MRDIKQNIKSSIAVGGLAHPQKRRFGLSTGIFGGTTVRVRHG